MSAALSDKPEANKLYIGQGVTIKGEVQVADVIVVDGVLDGDISVGTLLVREAGTIRGRVVVANDAEVFGNVFDRLEVRGLLVLHATSRVEGNVTCGRLTIEQGARITGGIASASDRAAPMSLHSKHNHDVRVSNGASSLGRLDLSALELMPGPVAATA
jgi:cytoskeletal protein CcmA (bactofilin family)